MAINLRERWEKREARLDARETEMPARTRRRRYRRAIAGYLILLAGLGGNMYADRNRAADGRDALVDSSKVVVIDSCNRDFRAAQSDRALLISARVALMKEIDAGRVTRDQAERSLKFYSDELAKRPLPDCRRASEIITSDPVKAKDAPPPPSPLYPGSPDEGNGP